MHGSMEIVVIRKGRKRRIGAREKNGRVQRERGIDPKTIAADMPHRSEVPEAVRHDPKAESVMGRMCLNGWITEDQYNAGKRFRDIVMRYRATIGCPSDMASMAGVIVGPWGGGALHSREELEYRKDIYMAMYEHLENIAGHHGARAVTDCAVHERSGFTPANVKRGLDALISFFALTDWRKSGQVRNRC